jgi:hypothetical protein
MENQSHYYVGVQTYRDEKKEFWNHYSVYIRSKLLFMWCLVLTRSHVPWIFAVFSV